MYINKVRVTIAGKYQANAVHSVKIKSTWRDTMTTCQIELPGLGVQLKKQVKEGDEVRVEFSQVPAGSESNFKTEFTGYIAQIKKSVPFTLACEDESYIWKRKPAISKFYKQIKVKDLLEELFGDAVDVRDSTPDITLVKLRLNRVTPFEVLQKIKQQYFLTAYFRNGKLLTGVPYLVEKTSPKVIYSFEQNIIKDSLTFKSKDNVKLKARVISIMGDGSKIEFSVGDTGGAERVLRYRGISDKSKLETLAKIQLEKLKKDTIEGSFTTFGVPFVQHSHVAELRSTKYPEKQGLYFIDGVQVEFSTSGFRRKIKLGKKMNG